MQYWEIPVLPTRDILILLILFQAFYSFNRELSDALRGMIEVRKAHSVPSPELPFLLWGHSNLYPYTIFGFWAPVLHILPLPNHLILNIIKLNSSSLQSLLFLFCFLLNRMEPLPPNCPSQQPTVTFNPSLSHLLHCIQPAIQHHQTFILLVTIHPSLGHHHLYLRSWVILLTELLTSSLASFQPIAHTVAREVLKKETWLYHLN